MIQTFILHKIRVECCICMSNHIMFLLGLLLFCPISWFYLLERRLLLNRRLMQYLVFLTKFGISIIETLSYFWKKKLLWLNQNLLWITSLDDYKSQHPGRCCFLLWLSIRLIRGFELMIYNNFWTSRECQDLRGSTPKSNLKSSHYSVHCELM